MRRNWGNGATWGNLGRWPQWGVGRRGDTLLGLRPGRPAPPRPRRPDPSHKLPRASAANHGLFHGDPTSRPTAACPGGAR
jgi:hypothetical protein